MPENDNGRRERVFQTCGGAESEALRLALRLSASGLARPVLFAPGAYQPREGGPAFEVTNLIEGWGVRQIPTAELVRRIEAGMRHEIASLLEKAADHSLKAEAAEDRGSVRFAGIHRAYAHDYHDMARTLEAQLTVRRVG